MINSKPVLILQLRPENTTADSEYACFLKYGQLKAEDTHRIGNMWGQNTDYANIRNNCVLTSLL